MNLVAVEYASIGVWGGLTTVGIIYMIYRRRAVKGLDISELSKQRLIWQANASLIICLCSAASIGWALLHPMDLSPVFIERAIFARAMWIVSGVALIVLSLKLDRSSFQQEADIHRDQRRKELESGLKDKT